MRILNEAGEQVILQAAATSGNWFLLEMWMLTIEHGQFPDQYEFRKKLGRSVW